MYIHVRYMYMYVRYNMYMYVRYMCYLYHGFQGCMGFVSRVWLNVFSRVMPEGIHLTTRMVQTHTPLRAMVQVTYTLIHVCRLLEACRHMLQA